MTATPVSSPARLDYGLDTLLGRISKSAECLIGLEVEPDQAPLLRVPWFQWAHLQLWEAHSSPCS